MLPLGLVVFCVYLLYSFISHPGSLDGYLYLGGLILLELIGAAVWNYQRASFPF